MIAYCFANGVIKFGARTPRGALKIASHRSERRLRNMIGIKARLAYDGKTLLVPGVPEAKDQKVGVEALLKWIDWIKPSLKEAA